MDVMMNQFMAKMICHRYLPKHLAASPAVRRHQSIQPC